MARIRTIKPEFWSSPNLPADPWARLLFQAMWNWADDDGRGTANPRELMGFAFPNEEWMTLDYFRRLLGGVRRAFGVKFYRVAGRPYYEIPSWDNHQKIDKRSQSRHPAPEGDQEFDPDPEDGSDQRERHESEEPAETPPTPPRALDGSPALEQRNRGTGELTPPTPPNTGGEPKPDVPPRTDVERLCRHLAARMVENGCREPGISERWRRAARLLLDEDKRPLDEALRLIDWSQNDDFWRGNIQSLPKFREKYDQLRLKAAGAGLFRTPAERKNAWATR